MAQIPPRPPWVKGDPDEPQADPVSAAPPQPERAKDARGRWLPGVSGNPSGRKSGVPDLRSRQRRAVQEGIDEVIEVVRKAALEGDMTAAGLLLARAIPPLRPESTLVEFELDTGAPISDQCKAIMQAAADGKITLERAERFIKLVGNIKDIVDVESVLDELERLRRRGKTDKNLPAGHVLQAETKLVNGKSTVVIRNGRTVPAPSNATSIRREVL